MTIRVRFRLISWIAVLTLAAGAGAAWTYAATARSVPAIHRTVAVSPSPNIVNGVDQAALAKCISQRPPVNCESVVPGLAACMAEELVCNQSANETKPTTDSGTPMTRAEAISAAVPFWMKDPGQLCLGDGWKGLTDTNGDAFAGEADCVSSVANGGGPHYVAAVQMQYGAYLALVAELPDPNISLARIVWVVTVEAPIWTDGSPMSRPRLLHAYTVVYDAALKHGIEMCIGCATLPSPAEQRHDLQ
jgi:hypothetical protein